ncbi:MAG: phage portal protein [Firmicutes bacterium]|nr:phage portal protein [Bacillota bacterium]
MEVVKNMRWYLEKPERFLEKKPFWRGGDMVMEKTEYADIDSKIQAALSKLRVHTITQDTYLSEYNPTLHKINYNRSAAKITITTDSGTFTTTENLTITSSFQKDIHATHVQYLATNPMVFEILNNNDEKFTETLTSYKNEWKFDAMESVKQKMISEQKKVGDFALLFQYHKSKGKGNVKVLSFPKHTVIPNYDEYGGLVGMSFYYSVTTDNKITEYIDTYFDKLVVKHKKIFDEKSGETTWVTIDKPKKHKFTQIPCVYYRSCVAWEYSQSLIEMFELIDNIHAVIFKRLGVFGMKVRGNLDKTKGGEMNFKVNDSQLLINIENSDSKDDVEILKFPSYEGFIEYKNHLEKRIYDASFVSKINMQNMGTSGNIGNVVQIAMVNNIGLANQSIKDWQETTNKMAQLYAEMKWLETNGEEMNYTKMKLMARLSIWIPQSDQQIIDNLMKADWISNETKRELSPMSATNEKERWEREQDDIAKKNEQKQKPKAQIENQADVEQLKLF